MIFAIPMQHFLIVFSVFKIAANNKSLELLIASKWHRANSGFVFYSHMICCLSRGLLRGAIFNIEGWGGGRLGVGENWLNTALSNDAIPGPSNVRVLGDCYTHEMMKTR